MRKIASRLIIHEPIDCCRKEKIEDTVVENLGEFPTSNLKRRIDDASTLMSEEIKGSNEQLNKLKMDLHSLQTKQSTAK